MKPIRLGIVTFPYGAKYKSGAVHKGDRLISAGDGIARSAGPDEATAFNVIGRALVDKLDQGPGTVEAIVTIK